MGEGAGSIRVDFKKCPDKTTADTLLKTIVGQEAASPPTSIDQPLILYGAGSLGRMAKEYLNYIGIPFQYVVDASPSVHSNDRFWNGISVVGPEDVSETDKKYSLLAVCISTVPYTPVYHSLTAQGWKNIVPFYDLTELFKYQHPLGNGWFVASLNEKENDAIGNVLNRWDDEISRAHHLQFLAWRFLRQEWVFTDAPITTNNRYFIPEILSLLHDHESFMDIGAYHGEVSIKFSEIVHGKFREVVAIEPDSHNIAILKKNFSKTLSYNQKSRTMVFDHVIAQQSEANSFIEKLGYASQISSLGKKSVQLTAIDSMEVTPSFIKLHVEGGELAALKGCVSTLLSNRPIIATAGYHNRLGLWELPQWLMDSLPDYRFLFRLHGWCGTGMVIYAIPKERITEMLDTN